MVSEVSDSGACTCNPQLVHDSSAIVEEGQASSTCFRVPSPGRFAKEGNHQNANQKRGRGRPEPRDRTRVLTL